VRRFARAAVTAWLCVALGAGCGYRVVGYRGVSEDPTRVSIRTLTNDTLEPGLELIVSEAMRRAFLHAGRIRLVEDPAAADYALSGRIVEVRTLGQSFTANVRALEFTVTMRLQLDVEARAGETPGLDAFGLAETEVYLASADIELSRKNRNEALRRLAKLLADRVYDQLELVTSRARSGAAGP